MRRRGHTLKEEVNAAAQGEPQGNGHVLLGKVGAHAGEDSKSRREDRAAAGREVSNEHRAGDGVRCEAGEVDAEGEIRVDGLDGRLRCVHHGCCGGMSMWSQ